MDANSKRWIHRKHGSRNVVLVLAGFVAAGLVLRFYGLENRGLWFDEVGLWHEAVSKDSGFHDGPLAQWLSFLFFALIRRATPFDLHIPPALFGAAAVPLAFLVAAQIGNRMAGLFSAGLLMLNHAAIYYSQEARPYGLFIFLTTLLYFSFIRAHTDHSPRRWLQYGVFTILCCLTHLLTLQILAALFLFSVVSITGRPFATQDRRFRIRRFIYFFITSCVGAGMGSFWALNRPDVARVLEGSYQGGLSAYLRTALISLGPTIRYVSPPHWGRTDLLGLIFVVLFFVGLYHFHKQKRYDLILFFLLVMCVPLLINYMTLGEKGYWPWVRYITHLIVPYLVVVACGAEYFRGFIRQPILKTAFIGVLALCFLPGIWRWREDVRVSRSSKTIQWTEHIFSLSSELKGLIIYEADGTMWTASKYFLYRKDRLPVYYVYKGILAEIVDAPSRGNITRIPEISGRENVALESGLYALYSREDSPPILCAGLLEELKLNYAISRREDLSPPGSIPICQVTVKSPQ